MNSTNQSLIDSNNGTTGSSHSYSYLAACVVALLDIISLLGNALVCFSFYYFRDLRTIPSYFIVSLSIADLMVAVFAMPFWFILQLHNNDLSRVPFILGAPYHFWGFIDILCGSASIYSLTAVSVDRHYAITSPMHYPRKVTSRRVIILLVCLWLFSALVAAGGLPPFLEHLYSRQFYMFFVPVISFFLPLLVIVVMYGRIYVTARKQALKMRLRDVRATRTVGVVVGAFIICWMPFFVIVLWFAVKPMFVFPPWVISTIKWLAYFNSAINPLIYTLLNRAHRKAFKRLCMKCWKPGGYYGEHRRISLSFTTKGGHYACPHNSHEEDRGAATPMTCISSEVDWKTRSGSEASGSSQDHLKGERKEKTKKKENGVVHYEDDCIENGSVWVKRT